MNLSQEEKIEILYALVKYLNEITRALNINVLSDTPTNKQFIETMNEETESLLNQLNDDGVIIKLHESGKYYLAQYGDNHYEFIEEEDTHELDNIDDDDDDTESLNIEDEKMKKCSQNMQKELQHIYNICYNK